MSDNNVLVTGLHWPENCTFSLNASALARVGGDHAEDDIIGALKRAVFQFSINRDNDMLKKTLEDEAFDPNATLHWSEVAHEQTEDNKFRRLPDKEYQAPVLAVLYATSQKYSEDEQHLPAVFPNALTFANGEQTVDPNDGGDLSPPLISSLRNGSWNIFPLLKHPEINPNVSEVRCYSVYTINMGNAKKDAKFDVRQFEKDTYTPLEMACITLNTSMNNVDRNCNVVAAMIDAGALITPYCRQVCEEHTFLRVKIMYIDALVNQIVRGEQDVDVQKLKHAYAGGRIGEIFTKAYKDGEFAKQVIELHDELPQWLREKTQPAYDMLVEQHKDWGTSIRERRNFADSVKRGGIE